MFWTTALKYFNNNILTLSIPYGQLGQTFISNCIVYVLRCPRFLVVFGQEKAAETALSYW